MSRVSAFFPILYFDRGYNLEYNIQHTLLRCYPLDSPCGYVRPIPNGSNLVVFTYESYESYLEDMAPSKAIELDAVLIDCSNERASSQDPSRVQWPKPRLRVRKILASGRSAQLARRC